MQTQLQTMANAYAKADGFAFSRAANQLRDGLRQLSPRIYPAEEELRLEYFYNHFDGFYRAAWAYGIALLLLAIAHWRSTSASASPVAASLREAPAKRRSYLKIAGVLIAIAGLIFHAAAITMRCLIAGRPPVTNMYESIIWVSFAVSFFGMIFFAALSHARLSPGRAARFAPLSASRPSNADRHAREHRSARPGPAR